jgi:hypothetical protein
VRNGRVLFVRASVQGVAGNNFVVNAVWRLGRRGKRGVWSVIKGMLMLLEYSAIRGRIDWKLDIGGGDISMGSRREERGGLGVKCSRLLGCCGYYQIPRPMRLHKLVWRSGFGCLDTTHGASIS